MACLWKQVAGYPIGYFLFCVSESIKGDAKDLVKFSVCVKVCATYVVFLVVRAMVLILCAIVSPGSTSGTPTSNGW